MTKSVLIAAALGAGFLYLYTQVKGGTLTIIDLPTAAVAGAIIGGGVQIAVRVLGVS